MEERAKAMVAKHFDNFWEIGDNAGAKQCALLEVRALINETSEIYQLAGLHDASKELLDVLYEKMSEWAKIEKIIEEM